MGAIHVLIPVLATVYLLAVSLGTTAARYEARYLVLLAGLFALLALTLHLGVLVLTRWGALPGALGALAAGAVLVWHLREQARIPEDDAWLALAVVAVAVPYAVVVRWTLRVAPARRALRLLPGCAAAFAVAWVASYQSSNTFRWHLLRHNRLLGTPAFLLLSPPVAAVESELWESRVGAEVGDGPSPAPATPPPASAGPRPNLVFILLDTLRADALAAYAGDPAQMPNLNRLAEEALVFTDVMANSSWTRPSLGSMFTGLLPEEHGAVDRGDMLPERRTTLAERARALGYRTAAFVANPGAVGREAGFAQGFETFVELRSYRHAYARATAVTDAVAAWLADAGRPGAAPLFLYVHYLDPHRPYLSGGQASPRPEDNYAAYLAEVRYLDSELGRLFAVLERELPGPTALFVTSDHGEEFGEHGELGHGHSLYPELLHIPALLHVGGARGRIESRLEGRDLHDLLLALAVPGSADVPAWAEARGRERRYASLYLTTGSASLHRPYLHSVSMRGVEVGPLHLIWSGYGPTVELYDRERDRDEQVNLARRHPERVAALSDEMDASVDYWAERAEIEYTPETIEQLRALGYIAD